jgi:hypothetical protein
MPVLADDLLRALQRAGLLAEVGYYKRIVITAEANSLVTIEVEMEADDRLINVIPDLAKDPA